MRTRLAALVHRAGFALCRLSRRLEPGHERARKDEKLARQLLVVVAVARLSDDELDHELWRLVETVPHGSRTSEVILEAASRLERYRALAAEYAPLRPPGERERDTS